MNLDDIKYPNFDKIIELSKLFMRSRFPQYGNSWVDKPYGMNIEFWDKRLQIEVQEFFETAFSRNGDNQKLKKELIDIINICSMIYDNISVTPMQTKLQEFGFPNKI